MPSTPQLADLDFESQSRILNLPAPVDPAEPARLADLNSAVEGLAWKDSVRVATQSNINLSSPGATIDGVTMSSTNRVLVPVQTDGTENGIYLWNGASAAMTRAADASTAAELEQAVVTVEEGTSAGATFRQTAVNFTLGADPVAWTTFGTAASAASESTAGVAELATQGEVDTGTDDARFVTPLKLASHSGRKLKNGATVGDGTATQFDVTHNFGSRDLQVEVYRNATPWDKVGAVVSRPDTNTVRVNMTPAPSSNQFRVVILG